MPQTTERKSQRCAREREQAINKQRERKKEEREKGSLEISLRKRQMVDTFRSERCRSPSSPRPPASFPLLHSPPTPQSRQPREEQLRIPFLFSTNPPTPQSCQPREEQLCIMLLRSTKTSVLLTFPALSDGRSIFRGANLPPVS